MKKKNVQQMNGNNNHSNGSSKPQTQNVKIRRFEVTYSPRVMEAKTKGITAAIKEMTSAIYEKTKGQAIFYPTSTVYPQPEPIENIITHFPSTAVKLKDFFHVVEVKNNLNVQVNLAILFPGMTDSELHSLLNTLKHNNIWLASEEILAKKIDDIGFVENSNPDYTNSNNLEIAIEAKIVELVEKDQSAATTFTRVKRS